MEITLYDLTDSYINVLALIDNDKKDDEKEILKIEEELKNALDNIDEAIEQKAENIANILDECKGNSKKIEEQIKRLEKRKKSFDSTTDYLTDYLKKEMLKIDKTKFKTAFHTFYFKKNAPAVCIEKEDNIPEQFFKVTKSVMKTELKKFIQEGNDIEGVKLTQSESLIIR